LKTTGTADSETLIRTDGSRRLSRNSTPSFAVPDLFRLCCAPEFCMIEIELSLQSGTHFADLIFQKCSELQIYRVLCALCQQLCQIEGCNRGKKDPTCDPRSHLTWKKKQGFAPENDFTREFTASDLLHFPTIDDGWLTWWCGWVVDIMMWMLTMTIVRNSEVFKLNFLWTG